MAVELQHALGMLNLPFRSGCSYTAREAIIILLDLNGSARIKCLKCLENPILSIKLKVQVLQRKAAATISLHLYSLLTILSSESRYFTIRPPRRFVMIAFLIFPFANDLVYQEIHCTKLCWRESHYDFRGTVRYCRCL